MDLSYCCYYLLVTSALMLGLVGAHESEKADPLAFLRTAPQFLQMRQSLQKNPRLFKAFLEQIHQQNPRLLQMILQNQERFLQMLDEPVGEGGGGGGSGGGGGGGGQAQGGNPGSGVGPAMEGYIQVTPEEKQAIEED